MSKTSKLENKVLFAPRLKSLALNMWPGSLAPTVNHSRHVQLIGAHRDSLLELPVDVISVFQGNYELVLWRSGATTHSIELSLVESLRDANVAALKLSNYMPVGLCLYSRKESGEQPDAWRRLRNNLADLAGRPEGYLSRAVRLGALLVANALNNGWMSDSQLGTLCFMLRPEEQLHSLSAALRSAGLNEDYLIREKSVLDAARLVLERGEEFAATLVKDLR